MLILQPELGLQLQYEAGHRKPAWGVLRNCWPLNCSFIFVIAASADSDICSLLILNAPYSNYYFYRISDCLWCFSFFQAREAQYCAMLVFINKFYSNCSGTISVVSCTFNIACIPCKTWDLPPSGKQQGIIKPHRSHIALGHMEDTQKPDCNIMCCHIYPGHTKAT